MYTPEKHPRHCCSARKAPDASRRAPARRGSGGPRAAARAPPPRSPRRRAWPRAGSRAPPVTTCRDGGGRVRGLVAAVYAALLSTTPGSSHDVVRCTMSRTTPPLATLSHLLDSKASPPAAGGLGVLLLQPREAVRLGAGHLALLAQGRGGSTSKSRMPGNARKFPGPKMDQIRK